MKRSIAVLGLVVGIGFAIYCFFYDLHHGCTIKDTLLGTLLTFLMTGGILPGILHVRSIAGNTWAFVHCLPFPISFIVILPAIVFMIAVSGWLYLFRDLLGITSES